MAFLKVKQVKYRGSQYSYESPLLKSGINILEGENGTGKTTFANLVYFCLGGRVESFRRDSTHRHVQITGDKNNAVELSIAIDGRNYALTRYIGTNDIGVAVDGNVEVYPTVRTSGQPSIFSDWLLKQLQIEPMSLQYGAYSGKLNFSDLARLIYHDQAPDPSAIYKSQDANSFVADSRVFRKAIFEILIGKSYEEYYTKLAEFRVLEQRRSEVENSLKMFRTFSAEIQPNREDLNLLFIDENLTKLRGQAENLTQYRRTITKAPARPRSADVTDAKSELLSLELRSASLGRRKSELFEEVARLEKLKSDLVLEVTQIKKMMFTHEHFSLFSSNTCPYCLREVKRIPDKCVCGADVDEHEYERFFYNAQEYLAILKSRQKNVETVETAIGSLRAELGSIATENASLEKRNEEVRKQIVNVIGDLDGQINLGEFEQIETELASVRKKIGELEQQRELEVKREELETELNDITLRRDKLRAQVTELEAAADRDIQQQRNSFSAHYNEMMRKTVPNVRVASIDSDYMPVINGGEYTEASAEVARRLLYFTTMLYMSLADKNVRFPRFLLIDTPETAGIDTQNLEAALSRLLETIVAFSGEECQVILTTGIGKYPATVKPFVFGTLTKPDRFLLERTTN